MVKVVIADRRDLLGGRLLPILNGLRLAEKTGARFLTTWFTADNSFQSLVAGLPEILSGPFLETDPVGYKIDVDDPRLIAASRDIISTPCQEATLANIGDFLVMPEFDREAIVVDRRFSLYQLNKKETFSDVRSELARIFNELPKTPIIEDAIGRITEKFSDGRFHALHARRMHLTSETIMQINRFDSYHTSDTYRLVGEQLLSEADALLLASDSLQFVADMKAAFPGRSFSIEDALGDLSRFTSIQRALMDIVFLSRAKSLFGSLSAYGVVASVIGDGTFYNIMGYAADHDILGGDKTGSIAFRKALDAKDLESLLGSGISEMVPSPLRQRRARALLRYPGHEALALLRAVQALAARLSEFSHESFASDYGHYIGTAIEAASRASRQDATDALRSLEQGISAHNMDQFCGGAPLSDAVMAYIDFCAQIAIADCSSPDDAVTRYRMIIGRARDLRINPRGLFLRLGRRHLTSGNGRDAISAMRDAIAADPSFGDSWYHLSRALFQDGALADAIAAAQQATVLEPEQALYWDHLGAQLEDAGDLKNAIKNYKKATMIEFENCNYAAHLDKAVTQTGRRRAVAPNDQETSSPARRRSIIVRWGQRLGRRLRFKT